LFNKKAQVGGGISGLFIGAVGGAIAFGVLVITFSLLAQVLTSQQDTLGVTAGATATNESVSVASSLLVNAGTPTIPNNINNATEVVRNATSALTDGTDYTLRTDGQFDIILFSGEPVNITYDFTIFTETAEFNLSGQGLVGFINIGNLVPTMGLIFGIIVVLGLLVSLLFLFGTGRIGGRD